MTEGSAATARRIAVAAGLVLVATVAVRGVARWLPAAAVLAQMNGDHERRLWGIERAERDPAASRRLVVRVAGHWWDVPAPARAVAARRWRDEWRQAVADGEVAVVDAASGRAVVEFGPDGDVVEVTDRPVSDAG